jgi:hypothetical protein
MVAYVSTPLDERPSIMLTANVQERNVEGMLHYKFQVKRDLVNRVTFTFINYSPGMPSCDEYALALGEFVARRK